jgi:hypothetical protein
MRSIKENKAGEKTKYMIKIETKSKKEEVNKKETKGRKQTHRIMYVAGMVTLTTLWS